MFENFRFETFVDVHSNIFEEYLSSVIAKLPKEKVYYSKFFNPDLDFSDKFKKKQ